MPRRCHSEKHRRRSRARLTCSVRQKMNALRKFVLRILQSSVRIVPAASDADAADWAARHYPDERERALAARFALILENQLNRSLQEFEPTSRFYEDLKMHDLEPVEVLMAIEQEFRLEIPREEAVAMPTFNDVVRYLASASAR